MGRRTYGEGDERGVDEDVDDVPEAVLEVVPRDRLRVHPCGPRHDDDLYPMIITRTTLA